MPEPQGDGTVKDMAHNHNHDHNHLAEILDLDAEVLHELHHELIGWVAAQVPAHARIIDVGAGSGTATLALAEQLPDAETIALDVDAEMLDRIQHKARAAGLADRVRTIQADLDQPWPVLDAADLVWAAKSLHHMADPAAAVARIFTVLRPGGLLAVTELESFPRFLADPAGAALEERLHAALAQARDDAGMHMHENWPARLTEAGFTVEAERRFDVALRPPLPAQAPRYALLSLCQARDGLAGRLSAEDLAELEALATTLPSRDDLTVRTSRMVWLARRPAELDGAE
jgi:ubiquinone/menaquinone biosynthesis C-methylase UbiE